jgi:hypothetical protein
MSTNGTRSGVRRNMFGQNKLGACMTGPNDSFRFDAPLSTVGCKSNKPDSIHSTFANQITGGRVMI